MKLAIVTETFPPEVNGVAMTFGRLARALGALGHTVTVWRPRRDDLAAAEPRPEFSEILVRGIPVPGYSQLRLGLPAPFALRRSWRAQRPDLVHVVTEGPLGASAINAARSLDIPVTSSFHTNFHAYTGHYGFGAFHRVALGWLRRVHNSTRRTFAPTTELCDELRRVGFRNLLVLSRGVDLHHFSPSRRSTELRASWGANADDVVVLHVGRMAAEKNYPFLFETYAAMRAANPKLRFVLAGEGPLRAQLQRQHPEAIFAGFFSREDIGRYYASADIYIHASLTETFGNVLTEAMASGLAVVGFNYAAARQFVRDGVNGLTAPCDSPSAFIAAAIALATTPTLRRRVGYAARSTLLDQTWDHVVARFEADLLAVVDETRARGTGVPPVVFPAVSSHFDTTTASLVSTEARSPWTSISQRQKQSE